MSTSVNLTTSMSSILYSLKNSTSAMTDTNNRLSSGLKVSSALDNPIAYFSSEDHNSEASSLSSLTDSMGEAIQTIKSANDGISSIKSLLDDAKSIAKSALSTTDTTEKAGYYSQFTALLTQITEQAQDSGYSGVNLLDGTDQTLKVVFDSTADSSVTLTGIDATATGLSLTAGGTSWSSGTTADTTAINNAIASIDTAKTTLRTDSKNLSTNLSTITARQSFTNNMINELKTGSSNLVNADTNEESANLLALQTQHSLGISSMSIASQAAQGVLKLF